MYGVLVVALLASRTGASLSSPGAWARRPGVVDGLDLNDDEVIHEMRCSACGAIYTEFYHAMTALDESMGGREHVPADDRLPYIGHMCGACMRRAEGHAAAALALPHLSVLTHTPWPTLPSECSPGAGHSCNSTLLDNWGCCESTTCP